MTADTGRSELAMATHLFTAICEAVGPGFHPDTPFDDYVHGEQMERSYTDELAALLDVVLNACCQIFDANNVNLYLLGCMVQGLEVGDDPETWADHHTDDPDPEP